MSRLSNYLRDTRAELRHVSWPTRNQAVIYTLLVIGISAITALMVSGFDALFTEILNLIINY